MSIYKNFMYLFLDRKRARIEKFHVDSRRKTVGRYLDKEMTSFLYQIQFEKSSNLQI